MPTNYRPSLQGFHRHPGRGKRGKNITSKKEENHLAARQGAARLARMRLNMLGRRWYCLHADDIPVAIQSASRKKTMKNRGVLLCEPGSQDYHHNGRQPTSKITVRLTCTIGRKDVG